MLLAGFQFFGTDSWQDIVGNFPFPKEGFETFDDVKAQIRWLPVHGGAFETVSPSTRRQL